MIKIGYKREVDNLKNLSKEVLKVITDVTTILDTEYGENRDVDGENGGYILVIEVAEELKEPLLNIGIDVNREIYPEYVDLIKCKGGENYINALILCSNDFGISLIMPKKIAPKALLDEMVE